MTSIRFQKHQRDELLRLGVPAVAIEDIERSVLGWAKRYLTREPPRSTVLKELRNVADALTSARSAIEALLDDADNADSRAAARRALAGGGRRYKQDGLRLDETSKSLTTAIEVMTTAIASVPVGPQRHKSADPYPVEFIHKALLNVLSAEQVALAKRLKPSVSATSPFRQIVGICYEVIEAPADDPERAIKAYLKQWRELQRYSATL